MKLFSESLQSELNRQLELIPVEDAHTVHYYEEAIKILIVGLEKLKTFFIEYKCYFSPAKEHEFKTIVLNSSIVSTGAKMKILRNIDSFDNKMISKVQTLMNTRNAFAHLPLTKSATIAATNKGGNLVWNLEDVSTQLDIMNSSGEIKKKNTKELIVEYQNVLAEVNTYLESYFTHSI